MIPSLEVREAFKRIENYILTNNMDIIAPVIDSIIFEYQDNYLMVNLSDSEDEPYCLL